MVHYSLGESKIIIIKHVNGWKYAHIWQWEKYNFSANFAFLSTELANESQWASPATGTNLTNNLTHVWLKQIFIMFHEFWGHWGKMAGSSHPNKFSVNFMLPQKK